MRRKERKETHTEGRRERGKEGPEKDWREKDSLCWVPSIHQREKQQ